MKYGFFIFSLALSAATHAADSRYDRCVALIEKQPQAAYDMASSWRSDNGGVAAMHCQGMALINLAQPARGAGVLDAAAEKMDLSSPVLAADLFSQAGNAWLLAGDATRATVRFTWALDRMPEAMASRADILIDRARAFAQLENKDKSLTDLSAAIVLAPTNIEARLLRAELYLSQGDTGRARSDLTTLKSQPMDADEKSIFTKLITQLDQ
jgi:tetratricopeptide (TPR) repeat protein